MTHTQLWLAVGVGVASARVFSSIRHRFVSVTVDGTSMSPTLLHGEKVLIRRGRNALRRGQIVIATRPDPITGWRDLPPSGRDLHAHSWFVKRVVAVGGDPFPSEIDRLGIVPSDHAFLLGDHPDSVDSKQFGPCPASQILGIYVRKLAVTSR